MSGPLDLFSHTVPEAHAKFLDASRDAGIEPEVVEHPLRGPDGEALHSVIARVGPVGASKVLLTISGTHGIEGYFGSAMQTDAVRRHRELFELGDDTAIVFVHLVNPWGTAWSSRENEDNVELLRGHYYCHRPKPPNPVFVDFQETMGYSHLGSIEELLAGRGRVMDVVHRHGLEALFAALVDGQDTHPDAITYVGRAPTWSKRLLDHVAASHLAGAERVVVFDLHTAVGPPGETVVFHPYEPASERGQLLDRTIGPLWPNDERLDFYGWLAHLDVGLSDDLEVLTVMCEAGTEQLPPQEQYIFPLDVWIKTYGDRHDPTAAPHLERYRRFFYPETDSWMTSVYHHFVERWPVMLALLHAPWPTREPI
jgi:hypothetical protein